MYDSDIDDTAAAWPADIHSRVGIERLCLLNSYDLPNSSKHGIESYCRVISFSNFKTTEASGIKRGRGVW